jgi:hypothetical protein
MYKGIGKPTNVAYLILAVVRWVCVRVPAVMVRSLSTFLRQRMWAVAVVRLVCDRSRVPVKCRRAVLLLKDLADLLHMGVLDEH